MEYASYELRNNESIVTIAVTNDGVVLRFASRELRNNESIVIIAVTNGGAVLRFASNELKNSKPVVTDCFCITQWLCTDLCFS